jgi:hypothetical protein
VRPAVAGLAAEPDQVEQLADGPRGLGPVGAAGPQQRLGDDVGDLAPRVERAERVLEHHLQVGAGAAQTVPRSR